MKIIKFLGRNAICDQNLFMGRLADLISEILKKDLVKNILYKKSYIQKMGKNIVISVLT